jgi:hypothetical protein
MVALIRMALLTVPVRLTCALLAASFPAVFAMGSVIDSWDSPAVLVLDVFVVVCALAAATVIQRWHRPPVDDGRASRGATRYARGQWSPELSPALLRRSRVWGSLALMAWLGAVVVDVLGAVQASSALETAAYTISAAAAGYLAVLSLRSRVTILDGALTSFGILRDETADVVRWRDVQVSHLGPVGVWAPQIDTGHASSGWVIGRCSVLVLGRSAVAEEPPD